MKDVPLQGAARAIARLARVLERACPELSLPQYRVLATVAEGDERASRLAERLALARPTITAAVDSLVDKGLISRTEVVGDRRASRLQITPVGKKTLRAAEEAMAERLQPVFERVDDTEAVLDALAKLQEALDQVTAERMAASR